MKGPKRTKTQIKKDRATIARLYLQGKLQVEIAERLDLTQQQISYDLKIIRKQWLDSSIRDFDELRSQELAKIDNLELEYWEAWQRSLEPKKMESYKTVGDGTQDNTGREKIVKGEAVAKEETRDGDPRFLQGVQWCIERRCKLLGFDEAAKVDMTLSGETKLVILPPQ